MDDSRRAFLGGAAGAGGQGAWGQVPMPPSASIPDADLASVIGWVLGQK